MRLLIAGGGTGGHLYPGIAVAEELLTRGPAHSVMFAGTNRGLEARVLPRLGFPWVAVRAAGLVGTGVRGGLRSGFLLLLGLADTARVLRTFRPEACLGVGGYVSFPVVALARLRGIPTALQEQNAAPGLTNRVLARLVRRVFAGDPAGARGLPAAKTRVTGNPLRRGFEQALPYSEPGHEEPLRVLVTGGSQGAAALNRAVPAALGHLHSPWQVLHQCGTGQVAAVRARYGEHAGVEVTEYIEDMLAAYRWAHLVISRAGALTVAELAASGRPAVLVPFPHSAGGHQEANARAAEDRGAAACLLQAQLGSADRAEGLADLLSALAADPVRLGSMAVAAAASVPRDAARVIVDELLALAGPNQKGS